MSWRKEECKHKGNLFLCDDISVILTGDSTISSRIQNEGHGNGFTGDGHITSVAYYLRNAVAGCEDRCVGGDGAEETRRHVESADFSTGEFQGWTARSRGRGNLLELQ